MWTVYILKCSDGTFYTGCTNDLREHLKRHQKKEISHTATRLPIQVVTTIVFQNKYKTIKFEKYLKSGSGIAFRNKRFV